MSPRNSRSARRLACALAAAAALPATVARAQDAAPDLSALGVQEEGHDTSDGSHPLQLYGFADLNYYLPLFPRDSFLASAVPENNQFVMGNFNLYLAKQISSRLRSLGEVRFTYLPNGQITGSGYTSTSADDPADLYRPVRWGGIIIERLYVEGDLTSNVTLRAGEFLTPYGIWNVDHGTPTLISIRRPYIIGESLFPERQVGLELIGHHYFSELGVEWHLTLSNGRGPIAETRDLDGNKAVGGRVVAEWKRSFSLRVGASFFRGRYTNGTPLSFDPMTGKSTTTILERYDEQSIAGDVSLDANHLVFRGEIIESEHRYTDDGRGTGPTFTPDNRRWGAYGLVGWRLPYGVLPFFLAQYYKFPETPGNVLAPAIQAYQAGINYRLHPNVILKAEYTYAPIVGSPLSIIRDTPFQAVETQVTWVF